MVCKKSFSTAAAEALQASLPSTKRTVSKAENKSKPLKEVFQGVKQIKAIFSVLVVQSGLYRLVGR